MASKEMQCLYIYPSPFNRVSDNNIGPIKMVHYSLLLLFSVALYLVVALSCFYALTRITKCYLPKERNSWNTDKCRKKGNKRWFKGSNREKSNVAFAIDELNHVEHLPLIKNCNI